MISDPSRFTIAVNVDESVLEGDTSICLGLIVTELVINSLKHAFPNGDGGKIIVDYRSRGLWWILCVSDDGVGIRTGAEAPKPGLGTGIIEALSRQLNCTPPVKTALPV
jgi:two-component sensor histidine kinase